MYIISIYFTYTNTSTHFPSLKSWSQRDSKPDIEQNTKSETEYQGTQPVLKTKQYACNKKISNHNLYM